MRCSAPLRMTTANSGQKILVAKSEMVPLFTDRPVDHHRLIVICPILFPLGSINQIFLSGPTVSAAGRLPDVEIMNSPRNIPEVVMRLMCLASSVNQRLPSGPAQSEPGLPPGGGTENSVISPCGVVRPILSANPSVNQISPSGPTIMSW